METNLKEIKRIAKIKENENWEFRTFLKGYDIEIGDLDSIVHKLYDQVSAKVDCTKCANCCKLIKVILSQNDIGKLLKGTGLSKQQFEAQFIKKEKNGEYSIKKSPCPFLKDNLCTQYDFRPYACRSFPHIHKNEFVFRLIEVVNNYSVCPIVFNVYEKLKEHFIDEYKNFIDFY